MPYNERLSPEKASSIAQQEGALRIFLAARLHKEPEACTESELFVEWSTLLLELTIGMFGIDEKIWDKRPMRTS